MFRKPRDQLIVTSQSPVHPSIGRPPTPSSADSKSPIPSITQARTMASNPLTPVLGRSQTIVRSAVGNRTMSAGKAKGKANGSILSFFKKAETPFSPESTPKGEQSSLFFEDNSIKSAHISPTQPPTPPRENGEMSPDKTALRYNEDSRAVKRRRTSDCGVPLAAEDMREAGDKGHSNDSTEWATAPSSISSLAAMEPIPANLNGEYSLQKKEDLPVDTHIGESPNAKASNSNPGNGPFVEDPESEDEMIRHWTASAFEKPKSSENYPMEGVPPLVQQNSEPLEASISNIPSLHREGTSVVGGDGFEGMEDFIDDEFPENGEEYMERVWMKEQEGLELGLEDDSMGDDSLEGKEELDETPDIERIAQEDDGSSSCPMCSESLQGITIEVSYFESCEQTT